MMFAAQETLDIVKVSTNSVAGQVNEDPSAQGDQQRPGIHKAPNQSCLKRMLGEALLVDFADAEVSLRRLYDQVSFCFALGLREHVGTLPRSRNVADTKL